MMHPTRLARVATVLVLLAGCAGGADASLITGAPDKAKAAGSARVTMSTVVNVGDEVATQVESEGTLDFARGTGRLTMTASSPQLTEAGISPRPCTMIHEASVAYLEVPLDRRAEFGGKAWLRADLGSRPGIDPSGYSSDPADILDQLRAVSSGVEDLGSEDVRGTAATHYRFTLSIEELLQHIDPEQRNATEQTMEGLEVTGFPMEVWVGADGLPLRLRTRLEPGGEVNLSMETTIEFFDYGQAESVEPPAADAVFTGADSGLAFSVCQGLPARP
jgi:hypothetical protein